MSASTTATPSSTPVSTTGGFSEGVYAWAANNEFRNSGISFVVFYVVALFIYGYQPQIGAPMDSLIAFYNGDRTRILIAAVVSSLNVLNLMWFAVTLRTTLADAGQDGWGTAATASSAALGGLFFVLIGV